MKYFKTFPKIAVVNSDNSITVATNLLARIEINPILFETSTLFYNYDYQEGDTPEIVASKYYGDSYRYWIFMYSNRMYDAFWDVPLNYNNFNLYLNDKYSANAESNNQTVLAYTQSTIYDYLLITNTYDSVSQETTTQTLVIDEDTYNATPPSDVQTAIFDDGTYTTVTTTTEIQYIYDYELQTNESKRSVSLINSSYANNLEKQFLLLMR